MFSNFHSHYNMAYIIGEGCLKAEYHVANVGMQFTMS